MNRLSVILALIQMAWRIAINVDRDIIHPLVMKWREEEAAKKNPAVERSTLRGGCPAAEESTLRGKGLAVASLLFVCLFCSSCAYFKQGVRLLDDCLQATQTTTNLPAPSSGGQAGAPAPAITNAPAVPPDPVPQPAAVVTYIPGDVRDKGAETALRGFGGFADVRYSANDIQNLRRQSPSIPAKGAWYPIDPAVVSGLSLRIQSDRSILCQAADFTSPRTGLRYRFCGYLIQVSTGALVTTNPLTIAARDCAKTLRIMYATVAE